jgi:hypothetical protein
MRHNQGQNSKRARGRGRRNGGHGQVNFNRNTTFDSNGPEGRLRGNAQQLFEKYTALAHDANAAGERISAEAFAQFADHYYRVQQSILQATEQQRKAHDERQQNRRREGNDANEAEASADTDMVSEEVAPSSASTADVPATDMDLSEEDAAEGVKKMLASAPARKPRKSKKAAEKAVADEDESQPSDDASEAVA